MDRHTYIVTTQQRDQIRLFIEMALGDSDRNLIRWKRSNMTGPGYEKSIQHLRFLETLGDVFDVKIDYSEEEV